MVAVESVTWIGSRRHPAGVLIPAMVACALAVGIEPLAAQVPQAPWGPERTQPPPSTPAAESGQPSALAEIDRLAAHTATFLRDHVPDRAGATIWVLPFMTDTGVATRLGHRLQSAVHLRLLRDYGSAEIRVAERRPLPSPALTGGVQPLPAAAAAASHALELEIQPFRETLRVVLRVFSSGAVSAGEWVDLPVSEELQELLDGTGTGAAAGRGQHAAPGAATVPAVEPGAEPGAPRTPLPSAITVDRGQQRYTTSGEDWVTLQVAAPGFYLLEGRSFSGPVTLSLHYDRTGPPVVTAREDARAGAGRDAGGLPRGVDRKLGIFSGPRRSYARIGSASEEHVAYYLRLRPLIPARRFADGTVHAVALERGTGFQTLRVFRSGSYRAVADTDDGHAELRVFSVPNMQWIAPASGAVPGDSGTVEPVPQRYELAAGDYLIEVSAPPAAPAARLCWAASDSNGGCAG